VLAIGTLVVGGPGMAAAVGVEAAAGVVEVVSGLEGVACALDAGVVVVVAEELGVEEVLVGVEELAELEAVVIVNSGLMFPESPISATM